jgi:hypothetical protein
MRSLRVCLFVAIAALLIAGCGPSLATQRRQAYINAHPELSPLAKQYIATGLVVRGMTMEEVRAAWGPPPADCPKRIAGMYAIWSYCNRNLAPSSFVFFDQTGHVTHVQVPPS